METNNTSEIVHKKKCVACQSSLEAKAFLCHVCSTYQNKLRRFVQYTAGVVGVLAIIASLSTYLWTDIPNSFFPDKVSILDFKGGNVTLSNEGYGKVFISHVEIISSVTDAKNIHFSIYRDLSKALEAKEISVFEMSGFDHGKGATYSVDGEQWFNAIRRSRNKEEKCFFSDFLSKILALLSCLRKSSPALIPDFSV